MDYVALIDERAACPELSDQLSGYAREGDGLGVYREVRYTRTSFFIGFLPKGVNVISETVMPTEAAYMPLAWQVCRANTSALLQSAILPENPSPWLNNE